MAEPMVGWNQGQVVAGIDVIEISTGCPSRRRGLKFARPRDCTRAVRRPAFKIVFFSSRYRGVVSPVSMHCRPAASL